MKDRTKKELLDKLSRLERLSRRESMSSPLCVVTHDPSEWLRTTTPAEGRPGNGCGIFTLQATGERFTAAEWREKRANLAGEDRVFLQLTEIADDVTEEWQRRHMLPVIAGQGG